MKSLILAGMAALASVGVVSVADRNDAVQTAELTTGSTQKAAGTKAFSISNLMAETACLAERQRRGDRNPRRRRRHRLRGPRPAECADYGDFGRLTAPYSASNSLSGK